jgi:CcmD family protein
MVPDTFDSLFWSYTAVWFFLAVYVLSLAARVKRLEKSSLADKKCCDVRE